MAGARREVRSPDGRLWRVWREFPWPRWRSERGDDFLEGAAWSGAIGAADDPEALVFGPIIFVVFFPVIVAITWIFLPLVLFIVELVLVVAAVLFLIRGWRVIADTQGPPAQRIVRRVRGWRSSKRAVEELAREVTRVSTPPPPPA